MTSPYSFHVKRDQHGRIVEKTETVAGESVTWTYAYDEQGRLTKAYLGTRLICHCDYDREGRRIRDQFPITSGAGFRNYAYGMDNRLMQAGDNRYTHDKSGNRSIWSHGGRYTTYAYAPDNRLLEVHQEADDIRYAFDHDENGQRCAKHRNGKMIEAYMWLDLLRLGGFYDGEHLHEFLYEEESRTPYAMRRDDGAEALLYYDQIGSLRVVADTNGSVIKEILYDPFGSVINDTNPNLFIPIGFGGGLHDRDIGFIRFGWRDYDPNTARWTSPDPMGDAGGDNDWYGYCLDDPVNGNDPLGLVVPLAAAGLLTDMAVAGPAIAAGTRLISRYGPRALRMAKTATTRYNNYLSSLYDSHLSKVASPDQIAKTIQAVGDVADGTHPGSVPDILATTLGNLPGYTQDYIKQVDKNIKQLQDARKDEKNTNHPDEETPDLTNSLNPSLNPEATPTEDDPLSHPEISPLAILNERKRNKPKKTPQKNKPQHKNPLNKPEKEQPKAPKNNPKGDGNGDESKSFDLLSKENLASYHKGMAERRKADGEHANNNSSNSNKKSTSSGNIGTKGGSYNGYGR